MNAKSLQCSKPVWNVGRGAFEGTCRRQAPFQSLVAREWVPRCAQHAKDDAEDELGAIEDAEREAAAEDIAHERSITLGLKAGVF